MASTKSYLTYVMDQLSDLEDIVYRPMMGEFIIYYRGKAIGGIYDDRLLLKDVPSVRSMQKETVLNEPYEGGKPMILIEHTEDRALLQDIIQAMYNELPDKRKQRMNKKQV